MYFINHVFICILFDYILHFVYNDGKKINLKLNLNLNNPDIKLEPWSDWTDWGRPSKVENVISALTIVGDLIFLKGIASGNLVAAHIMSANIGSQILS